MWYAKMYFSGKKEVFQYDAAGIQGVPSTERELPFLESLLSFLEMDWSELTPSLQKIANSWERLIAEDDRQAGTDAMVELGAIKDRHIYLDLLFVRWFDRFARIGICDDRGGVEDRQMLEELRRLPEQLPLYQRQVRRFFALVLDVDSAGRDPQQQAAMNYLYDIPKDPELFRFHPIPLSFEPVEPGRCSPVLYSAGIADMIDYSLRICVERGVTVRRCKHCGRWFPQTVRVSAEYCERPVARGQQTCREAGAFQPVDEEAVRRSGVQGLPEGVQAALRLDPGRAHLRHGFLRLERAGPGDEKEMRPGRHHPGGVHGVAEAVLTTKKDPPA